ncbi:DNA repair protein [Yoonia maritima]|uniref:DNA repair protein n=1 Tax=Yoonia maritima TaxID=1435347 RepID=UPI003734CA7A
MNMVSVREIARVMNIVCMFLVACAAGAAVVYAVLCAVGLAPWLSFSATFGQTTFLNAGQFVQILMTVVLVMLASFLPATSRVATLEASHRSFHLKMEDIAQAYYYCHAADRSGVFTMASEFDAVRERLNYLRDHPDLGSLEADVLEVAAQMSQQAKQLAQTYSDENVGRAKMFLRQRQQEVEKQKQRIADAMHDCRELEKWVEAVDMDESVLASQFSQLEERLQIASEKLGLRLPKHNDNVYPIQPLSAAE